MGKEKRVCAITGANGFLGSNLIRALVDSDSEFDWEIHAMHRSESAVAVIAEAASASDTGRSQVHTHRADIGDPRSLAEAIPKGCDVVFHVAASTNMWSKYNDDQTEINVNGTRNVCEVACALRAKRIVVTSSTSAYIDPERPWPQWYDAEEGDDGAEKTGSEPRCAPCGQCPGRSFHFSERSERRGLTSWINYAKTKAEAEDVALSFLPRIEVVVVNPGSMVGPFDTSSWARLIRAIHDFALPGVGPGTTSISDVRDVAAAHVAAAVLREASGERYILGGACTPMSHLAVLIARALNESGGGSGGRSVDERAPRELPGIALKCVAWAHGLLSRFITGAEPRVTPERAVVMRLCVRADSSKAKRDLGYAIRPVDQAVRDSVAWLRAHGELNKSE